MHIFPALIRKTCLVASIFLVFVSACKDDPCNGVDCGQFGECVAKGRDAACICQEGFELSRNGKCEVFSLSQFPGVYTATETCIDLITQDTLQKQYALEVTIAAPGEILLVGLGQHDCDSERLEVIAVIDENDFSIRQGVYCHDSLNQTAYQVQGNGQISLAGLNLDYHLSYSQLGTVLINQSCQLELVRP